MNEIKLPELVPKKYQFNMSELTLNTHPFRDLLTVANTVIAFNLNFLLFLLQTIA